MYNLIVSFFQKNKLLTYLLVGCKIEGINELEARESKIH